MSVKQIFFLPLRGSLRLQEPPTWVTRGGFGRLSMPCHEPLQVPMWLSLPSSARRAIGDDGPDHDPSQVRQVVKRLDPDLLLVLFTQIALRQATGHFSPAASGRSLSDPLFSFCPRARRKEGKKPSSATNLGIFCLFAL